MNEIEGEVLISFSSFYFPGSSYDIPGAQLRDFHYYPYITTLRIMSTLNMWEAFLV